MKVAYMSCVMPWNWLLLPKGCSVSWSIVYNVSSIKFSFSPVSYGKIRRIYTGTCKCICDITHMFAICLHLYAFCAQLLCWKIVFYFWVTILTTNFKCIWLLKKWARVDIDIVAYMSFSFTTINVHSSWSDNIFKNILNRRNFWYLFLIA